MSDLILGAGPAGLAAGYVLSQQGRSVEILEASPGVGGLAKSFEFEDHIVDLGPHRFFTKTPVVLDLWNEVLGDQIVEVDRLTRIYYRGKFFYYPLKAWNAFTRLGPVRSLHAVLSYLWVKLFPHPDESSFEGWVTNRFGKVLYESFFKSYTEKLWGVPCTQISSDWAAQRIKGLSLMGAVKTAILGNSGSIKTLIDRFEYPRKGTGQFYDTMAEKITEGKGQIHLGQRAERIFHDGKGRVTEVLSRDAEGNETRTPVTGNLLSSMPLTLMVQNLDPAPPEEVLEATRKLIFRNTILVFLMVEGTELFPDNWVYVHSDEIGAGRVTNFRNWSPEILPEGSTKTPISVEYWCFDEDPIWTRPDQELIDQAHKELEKIGLLPKVKRTAGKVIRLKRCYPVYKSGYEKHLAPVVEYLKGFENLQAIGRYGAFKYNNQDHSLLMGILAARNILGESHDLWAVNQDSEYQEEIRLHPDPVG